jgi:ADP-heptose:LPS heptosyltransferase
MTDPRILVIKHGAFGDIIQGLDAFAGLRLGRPRAHIALLTTPPFADFTASMPWFDEVIIDMRAPVFNLVQLFRIRKILRQRWDIILDLQCSKRTTWYQAKLASPDSRWFGTAMGASDPYPDFTGVNNADRMKTAVSMAGGRSDALDDMTWLASDIAAEITGALAKKPLVMVVGCSPAKPKKRWAAARFAALANLVHQQGVPVIIVGTGADRAAADAVLLDAPHCHDLIDQTDFAALASLFKASAGVVGNDTGPVFLAARTGTPTLMMMGPDTDPAMSAPVGSRAGWLKDDPIDAIDAAHVAETLFRL